MPNEGRGLEALRADLTPAEDPRSAYITRYVTRDVKLTAYTTTEIQIVSHANTKITVYLSWAFFWFGVLANGLMLPDAPTLILSNLFKTPYLFGFIGLLGLIGTLMETLQKQSLFNQINQEVSATSKEQQP